MRKCDGQLRGEKGVRGGAETFTRMQRGVCLQGRSFTRVGALLLASTWAVRWDGEDGWFRCVSGKGCGVCGRRPR